MPCFEGASKNSRHWVFKLWALHKDFLDPIKVFIKACERQKNNFQRAGYSVDSEFDKKYGQPRGDLNI